MVSFNKLFTSIFLAIVYASSTSAFAIPSASRHATHGVRVVGRGIKIESFHPASSFETFADGIDHPLAKRADSDIEGATISFVESKLKVASNTIKFRSGFSGEAAKHAYVSQVHDGIPFANAVANIAFNHDNKVVAFGSSFVKPKSIASSKPTIAVEAAISTAENALEGKFNNHPASLEYLVKEDGSVALTHVVQIQNESVGTWYQAFVDAHSGELLSITDFVSKASYLVLPITKEILTQGFETLTDPQDVTASPNGWHSTGTTSTTATDGNNILSYKSSTSSTTSQSSATLNFIYPQTASDAPTTTANVNAARVNAFYVGNTIHDFSYRYGFTEAAHNFQTNNFGKGGSQNDRVTISVQDSAGTNNADFSTPPDGQSGHMRMFLWTRTSPQRDGALENDIVVHEYTHGITNRMTGGGTGRCLQTTEAGGMGEGWSDAMAEWTEHTASAVPDYVMGQYVINSAAGIRTHPYSTSATVNPLRYSSIKTLNEVHNIGEVWANLLHNVYAALVSAHGWSATARTNPSGTEGNIVFLHLFLDALLLQPCNPTFVSARDAWIQADANRYAGANRCILWNAFASRGLGVSASGFNDNTSVPTGC
ncbi:Extracellular metalloproteinase mep [Hypsizygus marmoreus]|uniref:Extracellular metalloproteinase n=1 Tax=Hypsizygus marmoreus TaxID=39966 RepID=A0A369JE99_HYPMA|nr:Extracellular metalloproteinase mep [Hypsizygus marmoreus]